MKPLPGQLNLFGPPAPADTDGPPCLKCGGPTIVSAGAGPHHATITCTKCHSWR
jgi:hypothetical protein